MNDSNRKHNIRITLLVVGSFIFVNAIFFLFSDVFDILNIRINDQLFKLRYRIKGPEPVWNGGKSDKKSYITLIELDERGYNKLEELKDDVANQSFEADIINILRDAHVSAIAYDTVFATEAPQALIDATSRAKNLYYPIILAPPNTAVQTRLDEGSVLKKYLWYIKETRRSNQIDSNIYAAPKPELAIEAKGIGQININPDIDGVYRRVPLLIKYGGGYFPSLTLRVAADHLGVTPAQIEVTFGKYIFLKGAKFPDGSKKDIKIPINERGETIINFAGKWLDVFNHISFVDLLRVLEDEDLIKVLNNQIGDNLVIVADVSSRGKDFGAVPLENFYPLSNIHTNLLNSILTLNFIYELKPWQKLLIDLLLIVMICVAAIRTRALVFSGLTALIFSLFIAFVLWLFLYNNTLTNVLSPSLGIVFSFIFVNLYRYMREEQEKAYLFRTFESYFAPSVMNKILKNPERLESGEKKVLSVLFSDISQFTAWCTTHEPEEIHRTLNEYFSEMARIIFKYEGTVDKYMGDGMMAFFGDPIEYDDHALRAVEAAIEMQQKARELKKQWEAQGRLQIRMRIGINTGEVVVGNMGSKSRMDYTVLGSNVNLAQRLEANAPSEGILISQAVHNELKKEEEKDKNSVKNIKTTSYGKINVKGISEEIDVYQVELPEQEPEPK